MVKERAPQIYEVPPENEKGDGHYLPNIERSQGVSVEKPRPIFLLEDLKNLKSSKGLTPDQRRELMSLRDDLSGQASKEKRQKAMDKKYGTSHADSLPEFYQDIKDRVESFEAIDAKAGSFYLEQPRTHEETLKLLDDHLEYEYSSGGHGIVPMQVRSDMETWFLSDSQIEDFRGVTASKLKSIVHENVGEWIKVHADQITEARRSPEAAVSEGAVDFSKKFQESLEQRVEEEHRKFADAKRVEAARRNTLKLASAIDSSAESELDDSDWGKDIDAAAAK